MKLNKKKQNKQITIMELKADIKYYLDLCAEMICNDTNSCLDSNVEKLYRWDVKRIDKILDVLPKYDLVKKAKK